MRRSAQIMRLPYTLEATSASGPTRSDPLLDERQSARQVRSDRSQGFRLGHDSTERTELVQVAEHLDADGLVEAAHSDGLVSVGTNKLRSQVAGSVVVGCIELDGPVGLPPRRRRQRGRRERAERLDQP